MIIWSGFVFLVAVIGFTALIFTELVSEKITGDDKFYQQHGWVILIEMLVAAALTCGLHRLLLLKKGRGVIDRLQTLRQYLRKFCASVRPSSRFTLQSSFNRSSLKPNPQPAPSFAYAKPSFMRMGCVMRSSTQSKDSEPCALGIVINSGTSYSL